MIHDRGNFAVALPSGWTVPQFQFGQTVQVRESIGQVVGLEHYTCEEGAAADCAEGWWYLIFYPRTLTDGRVIADTIGSHESVIQAVPSLPAPSYECRVPVSR